MIITKRLLGKASGHNDHYMIIWVVKGQRLAVIDCWPVLICSAVYLKYTSSILQPIELEKKKYASSLNYFDKRSTFEAHFLKSNQHFNINLKYNSSIV